MHLQRLIKYDFDPSTTYTFFAQPHCTRSTRLHKQCPTARHLVIDKTNTFDVCSVGAEMAGEVFLSDVLLLVDE